MIKVGYLHGYFTHNAHIHRGTTLRTVKRIVSIIIIMLLPLNQNLVNAENSNSLNITSTVNIESLYMSNNDNTDNINIANTANINTLTTPNITYSKSFSEIYKSKNVYQDTLNRLNEFRKKYPSVTYLFNSGYSVQNRQLPVLKVGNGPLKIFINATHHPREYIGTIISLNQIQLLLESYSSKNSDLDGVNVKDLLNNKVSFYFMPLVNPDGVQVCVDSNPGYYWNANKVNLNHDYDINWEYSKKYATGDKPFSQPETLAVKALCENLGFDVAVSYHAAGDIIYWYYGQKGDQLKRDKQFANELSKVTGYSLVSPSSSLSGAGFKDWAVSVLNIPAFTIEVGGKRSITKPVEWSRYSSIWSKNKYVPLRLAKLLQVQGSLDKTNKISLIYKDEITSPLSDIIILNNECYIDITDAKSIFRITDINFQDTVVFNNKKYLSLKLVSQKLLPQLDVNISKQYSYWYDKKVGTVYIR